MSRNPDFELLRPVATSPPRPRHQVRRSITDLSSPIKLPRYHHLHHLRKDRDHGDRASSPAGSALRLSRASLDLPRPEASTSHLNSEPSPRTSMLAPPPEDAARGLVIPPTPQPLTSEEALLLRERQEGAESITACLRRSLVELSSSSNAAMTRLDDTYYAVLEKLGVLQSTLMDLKKLAGVSQGLNDSLREESRGLISELEQQASAFGQFDDQQTRIKELQGRIHAGREKVDALSKRVHVVRERIEGWERADKEWQERTRRRLKATWIAISIMFFSVMILLIGAQYAPSSEDAPALIDMAPTHHLGRLDDNEIAGNQSERVAAAIARGEAGTATGRGGDKPVDNNVLRVLDEL
ncbi:hypothetical protein GGS23DRAFT_593624 [Durotheca rogersii]|uniref:uncharacterized protein n=1 Tax=Durotheca rogersii TaxID=419775 RepID=UPI00221EA465|nr:uncharacterized protein GGS23DRAFT_593624 [Durotheca rogersii]KAI5866891.1 hypothetical protein GGS23DRAFT_593624 [Durotheca rogersii]